MGSSPVRICQWQAMNGSKSENFWAGGLLKTSDFFVILHRSGKTVKADAAYIFALLRLKVPNLRGFSELPQTSSTGFEGCYRPNVRENSKSNGSFLVPMPELPYLSGLLKTEYL